MFFPLQNPGFREQIKTDFLLQTIAEKLAAEKCVSLEII